MPCRKAVDVKRIVKIAVCVAIVFAQRSGGHPELESGLEILQDLAPVAFVARAASVALVNDDEVEKVSRVFAVQARPSLVFGEGLVNSKIHLAALDRLSFDF